MKVSRKAPSAKDKKKGDEDFVSVARRLECDEDKARFERKLKKIAKVKPAVSK